MQNGRTILSKLLTGSSSASHQDVIGLSKLLKGSSSVQHQMRNGRTILVTCSLDLSSTFASQQIDPFHGPMASMGDFPPILLSRFAFASFSPCSLGASAQETLIAWKYCIYLQLKHLDFCS
jgi:hypothetical protein